MRYKFPNLNGTVASSITDFKVYNNTFFYASQISFFGSIKQRPSETQRFCWEVARTLAV